MMDYLDVKRDDLNYIHLFGDATRLMQNAASRISEFIRSKYPEGTKICAVCGTGNNAGDGIAALELLSDNYEVSAVLVKGKHSLKTSEAKWALKNFKGRTLGLRSLDKELRESDVILDCLFGIGISGDPREPYAKVIDAINSFRKEVVSVDVPSGLGTARSVRPSHTITFTDVKRGMSRENSGNIEVMDIGIPEAVTKYAGPGDLVYFTKPDESSHKGMNGVLAILGGWEYYGSSVIAGLGANALGADLVRIYVNGANYAVVASYSPYLIVRNVDGMHESWKEELTGSRAVLIGPGMGRSRESIKSVQEVMKMFRGPIVVDADGINAVSGNTGIFKGKTVIFTPHRKEFQTLTGEDAGEENAVGFAKKHGVVIVLKGQIDVVTDGKRTIYVKGGNSRMTMGGTGDLLAGLISSAVSRGIDPFRSAVMGAYINKMIAEYAYQRKSYWYNIDDMITAISPFMMENVEWAKA